jgi:hypothetical protein
MSKWCCNLHEIAHERYLYVCHDRNAYRLLVGKPKGTRPLGRPRCRWVDNIKMDLGEIHCEDQDIDGWIILRWILEISTGKTKMWVGG